MENVVEELKRTNPGLAYDQLRKFNISRTRSALAVHLDNPIRYMVRPGGGIQLSMETQLGIRAACPCRKLNPVGRA